MPNRLKGRISRHTTSPKHLCVVSRRFIFLALIAHLCMLLSMNSLRESSGKYLLMEPDYDFYQSRGELERQRREKERGLDRASGNRQKRTTHSKVGDKQIDWWREASRVDTANHSHPEHPHLGARLWELEGRPILHNVVDPSPKRLKAPTKNFIDSVQPDILCPDNGTGTGIEEERGKEALLKVKDGIQKYNSNQIYNSSVPGEHRKSKILCMVYTVDTPKSRANVKAQAETWGRKCDGFFAASNVTDHSIGAIDLVHQGPETYGNMWQKIRSMWAYAYDHYLEEYDFFHIAGDDVYIVVENLRAFLDGPDVRRLENGYLDAISRGHPNALKWVNSTFKYGDGNYTYIAGVSPRPLYFGDVGESSNWIFPCGGPGYTLNRAALQFFGRVGLQQFSPYALSSREDVLMGKFFGSKGIIIGNTLDRFGGQRYGETAAFSNGGKKFSLCPGKKEVFQRSGLHRPYGLDGISEEMLAFHLKWALRTIGNHTAADLLYRYHAILYDICQETKTTN